MKIVIITQDEPFYLYDALSHFLNILPANITVCACVVSNPNPFGKRKGFLNKAFTTYKIFGVKFFMHYSTLFLINKLLGKSMKNLLNAHKIPQLVLTKSINHPESVRKIKTYEPDLAVSILGNEIFKKNLIDQLDIINLHTAKLPKYRGLMPTFWVLKNKEHETAATVFLVDEGIDSGPILKQELIEINGMSQKELIKRSKRIGVEAIVDVLTNWKTVSLKENNAKLSTYYGFPKKSDVAEFRKSGGKFF